MSKYLYISGGGVADYAASSFEDDFEGDKLELWYKAKEAGKELEYDDEDNGIYFWYEALELDDATVEQIQNRIDSDYSNHDNYFKVEG